MKKYLFAIFVSLASCISFSADSEMTDLLPDDPVVLGKWNLGMEKCITYARDNNIPLFALWEQKGCAVCAKVVLAIRSDTFVKWRTTNPKAQIVFCVMVDGVPNRPDQLESDAFHWMRIGTKKDRSLWPPADDAAFRWNGKLVNYPYAAFYWASKKINVHMEGSASFTKTGNTPDRNAEILIAYLEKALADYTGPQLAYPGGDFVVGDTVADRMEIEQDFTKTLTVPFSRTNVVEQVYTNELTATWGASTQTVDVVWAGSSRTASAELPVPVGMKAGDRLQLVLHDREMKNLSTNYATCVVTTNAASNPCWLGERTSDTLKFGEWTMDLDVATQKVAKATGDAYTLVLITGSIWCPHCKGLERQVLSTPAFTNFVFGNQVALVTLDNPRRPTDASGEGPVNGKPPTLLRYAVGVADTARGRQASGAGYMTRHHVDETAAESKLQENQHLGYRSMAAGGFCPADQEHAPYPTVMLMDKGGRIIGHIPGNATGGLKTETQYPWFEKEDAAVDDPRGDKVSKLDVAATVERLNDLVRLSKLGQTAAEDLYETSPLKIGVGPVGTSIVATNRLNASGLRDAWCVTGKFECVEVAVRAVGAKRTGHAVLAAVAADGNKAFPAFPLESGIKTNLWSEGGAGVKLLVRADAGDADGVFSPFAGSDSLREYELRTSRVVVPSAIVTNTFDDLSALLEELALYIEENRLYMLKGVDVRKMAEPAMEDILEVVDPDLNLYRARKDGVVSVPLAEAQAGETTKTFSCFEAESVEIGFLRDFDAFAEPEEKGARTEAAIGILRLNSLAGEARTVVEFLGGGANTNRYAFGEEWRVDEKAFGTTNLATEVVWAANDAVKQVVFQVIGEDRAYGDQQLDFKLRNIGSQLVRVPENRSRFTATLKDNDEDVAGALAIVDAVPYFSRQMQIIAVRGQKLVFTVARTGGFAGDATAHLELYQGGKLQVQSETKKWIAQETEEQTFELTLNGESPATEATVVLVPDHSIGVVSSKSTVTVKIVPDGLPKCVDDDGAVVRHPQHVQVSGVSYTLEDPLGGVLSVAPTTGALPAGLTGSLQGGRFVISGAPTATGAFAATYQVSADRGGKLVRGMTFTVRFDICSLALSSASHRADIPVFEGFLNLENGVIADDSFEGLDANGYVWGLLNLTIPANGRASAKLVCMDGTFAYSAASWTGWGENSLSVELSSEKAAAVFGDSGRLRVEVLTTNRCVRVSLDRGEDVPKDCVFPAQTWTIDAAKPWAGDYTVQFQQAAKSVVMSEDPVETNKFPASGNAVMRLKMAASAAGRMTFAGTLPNGRTVSGASVLIPRTVDGNSYAELPFFSHVEGTRAHDFSGTVLIQPNGWEKLRPDPLSGELNPQCIVSRAETCPCWLRMDAESRFSWFEAFGSAFDGDRLTTLCEQQHLTNLVLGVSADCLASVYGGVNTNLWPRIPVSVAGNMLAIEDPGVKFVYDRASGSVGGSFTLPLEKAYVTVNFKGVLMPGWVSLTGECSECGYGISPRHLMSGSCWFEDESNGKSFSNGCEVWIDTEVK